MHRTTGRHDTPGLVIAALAAVVGAVALGCSTPAPAAQVAAPPAGTAAPQTSAAPADGCPTPPTPGPDQATVIVDYVDFIRFDGRSYLADPVAAPISAGDLGEVVTTSRCALSELNERTHQQPAGPVDRDTGFLTAGTPVHAVRGWSPACRLAAEHGGQLRVYLAQDGTADTARADECAVG